MSTILYVRISTQNIACAQRQMHTCIHHSVIHYEHSVQERDRDREGMVRVVWSVGGGEGMVRVVWSVVGGGEGRVERCWWW